MRYLKDEEPIRIFFLLALIFIFYFFILKPMGFLSQPALRINDYFTNAVLSSKGVPIEAKDIIIVAVDNSSLDEAGLKWPWKRSVFAELLGNINSGGAKAVFFDFAFSGKSEDENSDMLFAQEIQKSGNVILAGYVERGRFSKPYEAFLSKARAVGIVNKKPDSDLRVRRARVLYAIGQDDNSLDYCVESKILALTEGVELKDITFRNNKVVITGDFQIPVDSYGLIPINYSLKIKDFLTVPAARLLGAKQMELSVFKDKVVMVGMTAGVGHDIHDTPLGEIPGVYINAITLLMFMSANFLKVLHPWLLSFTALFFSLGVGFCSLRLKAWQAFLAVLIVLSLTAGLYLFLVLKYSFNADIFSLLFITAVSLAAVECYKYVSLVRESHKIKLMAITDSSTGLYTQRYFQLFAQSILQKRIRPRSYFICKLRINELSLLRQKNSRNLPSFIKMISELIREYAGKNALISQYDETDLSLLLAKTNKKKLEEGLKALISEITQREFILDNESFNPSIKIAMLDFPRTHIRNYTDLILTLEALFGRIEADPGLTLAVFDSKADRIVRSGLTNEEKKLMPKKELDYVSLDLEARNKELEDALERLRQEQGKNERYYFQTIHSLVKALEEKDPYTAGHSERVGFYATELALGLSLPKKESEAVNKAAYLHDIGKIGLPDRVLHKKERLSDEDFAYIKRHQADGAKILEGLPFLEDAIPYILYHHERYDGKGYPHGLSGDMIPRGAQIIAIADSFDAMTTGRGYNQPLLLEQAIEELKKSSRVQFNPVYVNKFIELLNEKKIRPI